MMHSHLRVFNGDLNTGILWDKYAQLMNTHIYVQTLTLNNLDR